jgi:hypothetical protein
MIIYECSQFLDTRTFFAKIVLALACSLQATSARLALASFFIVDRLDICMNEVRIDTEQIYGVASTAVILYVPGALGCDAICVCIGT